MTQHIWLIPIIVGLAWILFFRKDQFDAYAELDRLEDAMNNTKVFSASTRAALEEKLDAIYALGVPFKDVPLILPATGNAFRSSYRDFTIRYWRNSQTGCDCYDTAVDFS